MQSNFPGNMDRRTTGAKSKIPPGYRLFSASLNSVFYLEVFALIAFFIITLSKMILQSRNQPREVLTSGWTSYLKFLGSFTHTGLFVSFLSITYIHGINATVVKKVPVKRYQIVTQFLDMQAYSSIVFFGIGCVAFVQAGFGIFEVSLASFCRCKKLTDVNPKYGDMVCVDEKNLFTSALVLVLVVAEYVKWKTTGGYVLEFHQLPKRLKYHVAIHLWTNRMLPLRRFILTFPIGLIVFKCAIQTPLRYVIPIGINAVFQHGMINTWFDALGVEFIFKSLVASYMALAIFHCQWIVVNYALVQRENSVIHSIFPDSNLFMHRDFIGSDDLYTQTLGWFDITRVTQKSCARLMELFVLSHPGNRPTIWKFTVDQCIRVGTERLEAYRSFMAKHSLHPKEISRKIQIKALQAHGGGLTMYSPSLNSLPDVMRPRHMIGRDLSSTPSTKSTNLPVSGRRVQLGFWETIYLGPNILWNFFIRDVKTRFAKIISLIKKRNIWIYWMQSDFDLEFKNLLSDSFLMLHAIHVIVDAIGVAVNNQARNIIQQDIYRLNQFFIDIYEAMDKLGRLIPKKVTKYNKNGEIVEIYSELKAEHGKLQNELKYEVYKYYESVAPYFENIGLPPKMYEQLLKIIDEVEVSGSEVNLDED